VAKNNLKPGEWTYADTPSGWELRIRYGVSLIALLPQYAKRNAWMFILFFLPFFGAFFWSAGMVTEWHLFPMFIATPLVLIVTLVVVALFWPFRLLKVFYPETKRAYRLRSSEAHRTVTITLQDGGVTAESTSFPLIYLEKLDITPYGAYSGLFRVDGFDADETRWELISWPGLPKSEIQAILAKISTSKNAPFKYELLEKSPENTVTSRGQYSETAPAKTSLSFRYGNERQGSLLKCGFLFGVAIGGITPFLLMYIWSNIVSDSSSYGMVVAFCAFLVIGIGLALAITFSIQKLIFRRFNFEGRAAFDDSSVALTYQGRTVRIPYKEVRKVVVVPVSRPANQGGGFLCSIQSIGISTADATYFIPVSLSENRQVNFARYGKKWRPRVLIDPEDILFDQEYLQALSLTQVLEEIEHRRGATLFRDRHSSSQ